MEKFRWARRVGRKLVDKVPMTLLGLFALWPNTAACRLVKAALKMLALYKNKDKANNELSSRNFKDSMTTATISTDFPTCCK